MNNIVDAERSLLPISVTSHLIMTSLREEFDPMSNHGPGKVCFSLRKLLSKKMTPKRHFKIISDLMSDLYCKLILVSTFIKHIYV